VVHVPSAPVPHDPLTDRSKVSAFPEGGGGGGGLGVVADAGDEAPERFPAASNAVTV
jgi:hypothetical protein